MAIVGNARMDASRQADENCLKAILMIHIDKGRAYVSDLAGRCFDDGILLRLPPCGCRLHPAAGAPGRTEVQ